MIERRCGALIAMVFAIACGAEDNTDSTSNASASSEDTGTDPSATTSPSTSATTTSASTSATTTSASTSATETTSPPETSASDPDTGPMEETAEESGPMETAEESGPMETGESGPMETGEESGGALEMCLDMAADGCEECACENCLPEVMACQADPGCVEIRMCAQENDCTGIGCLGPCGDVINANGGPLGESAGLASALSDCYEGACGDC